MEMMTVLFKKPLSREESDKVTLLIGFHKGASVELDEQRRVVGATFAVEDAKDVWQYVGGYVVD